MGVGQAAGAVGGARGSRLTIAWYSHSSRKFVLAKRTHSRRADRTRYAEARITYRITGLRPCLRARVGRAVNCTAARSRHGASCHLSAGEVRRLVAAANGEGATGRRDRAVLLLLARLGLRSQEVTAIRLDDLNWRTGEIAIRGKGGFTTACRCRSTWAKRFPTTF